MATQALPPIALVDGAYDKLKAGLDAYNPTSHIYTRKPDLREERIKDIYTIANSHPIVTSRVWLRKSTKPWDQNVRQILENVQFYTSEDGIDASRRHDIAKLIERLKTIESSAVGAKVLAAMQSSDASDVDSRRSLSPSLTSPAVSAPPATAPSTLTSAVPGLALSATRDTPLPAPTSTTESTIIPGLGGADAPTLRRGSVAPDLDARGTFTSAGRDTTRGRHLGSSSVPEDEDGVFVLDVRPAGRAPDRTPGARSISPSPTSAATPAAAAAAAAATSVAADRDEPLPEPSSRPPGASLAGGPASTLSSIERVRDALATQPHLRTLRREPSPPLHLDGTGERVATAAIGASTSRDSAAGLSTPTDSGLSSTTSRVFTTHREQILYVERNEETLTIRSDSVQMKTREGQTDHLLLAAQAIEIARREFSGDGEKPQIILSKGPAEVLYYIQQIAKALEAKGLMVLEVTPDAHAKINQISDTDKEAFDRNILTSFGSTDPETLARNFLRIYEPTSGGGPGSVIDGTDRTLIESFVREHPLPPSMSSIGTRASADGTGPSADWLQEFTEQISQVGLFHTVNVDDKSQFYTQADSTRTFSHRP